jgi:hypothetical protein
MRQKSINMLWVIAHDQKSTYTMKNCIHWNHITLQLKLEKQLIYKCYATILGYYNYVQLSL